MSELSTHLQEFEAIINVQFQEPQLLRRALTHRSFVNEAESEVRDNERLEFLGDAILDFIVAEMLFRRFPDVSEGDLTQLRAALVRTESLASLASDVQLGEYLLIGKGEENSGGRTRANNLCRGFEAVVGAVYIDSGLAVVEAFVLPRLERLLDYVLKHNLHQDARSILQERSQAELRHTPSYHVVGSLGPEHEKEYLIEVRIARVGVAKGTGTSKRAAAQDAARVALVAVDDGWPDPVLEAVERLELERQAAEAEKRAAEAAEAEQEDNLPQRTIIEVTIEAATETSE